MSDHEPMALEKYINQFYKGDKPKSDFALDQDVKPAQVTQWIKKKFMVVNHELLSHRRYLAIHPKSKNHF